MIVFTVGEQHLVPDTGLSMFGFLRDKQTSPSWVTWLRGFQKLKEAKRDPSLGHQRQSSPAHTLFQNSDLQNCERIHCRRFKPSGLWWFAAVAVKIQDEFPEMKNKFFVIFFLSFQKSLLTSWHRLANLYYISFLSAKEKKKRAKRDLDVAIKENTIFSCFGGKQKTGFFFSNFWLLSLFSPCTHWDTKFHIIFVCFFLTKNSSHRSISKQCQLSFKCLGGKGLVEKSK